MATATDDAKNSDHQQTTLFEAPRKCGDLVQSLKTGIKHPEICEAANYLIKYIEQNKLQQHDFSILENNQDLKKRANNLYKDICAINEAAPIHHTAFYCISINLTRNTFTNPIFTVSLRRICMEWITTQVWCIYDAYSMC